MCEGGHRFLHHPPDSAFAQVVCHWEQGGADGKTPVKVAWWRGEAASSGHFPAVRRGMSYLPCCPSSPSAFKRRFPTRRLSPEGPLTPAHRCVWVPMGPPFVCFKSTKLARSWLKNQGRHFVEVITTVSEEIPRGFCQPLLLNEPTHSARSVEIILPRTLERSPMKSGDRFYCRTFVNERRVCCQRQTRGFL